MEKCCSECSEPRMAQSLCTFCNKWLCFQCTDLHQHERASTQPSDLQHQQRDPLSPSEIGAGCCGHAVVMCPFHKQEPLELLCETCNLLACSICHLSAHTDHRLVHVGKALQDQRCLLQNLMARVEEKRSTVESTAKQIQGRLHGIKITQRKAENQIKMAKMIMMNELNKRANLLIEQLESISSDFKQRLEDQLQGAIELCSQLEHVQNFITWATSHHRRNPLLFSKELIALQMQQLLEPLMLSESWPPLKIKFNWDASFWTKQMSTLGQLVVEGGSHSYSEVVGHPSILRPQPVPYIAMPALCHAVREPGCTYQTFCQPQLCCLHCRPTQSVPLDKYSVPLDKYPIQCPQATSRSSPPSLHSCWEADASVPLHPTGSQPTQQSTSHLGSDLVHHGSSTTLPQQPAGSNNHQLLEALPANPHQTAADWRIIESSQHHRGRGQTPSPESATGPECSPDREQPQTQNQAQAQLTTDTSNQLMVERQPIIAIVDSRRSSALDMDAVAQGQEADSQSHSKRRTRSQDVPAGREACKRTSKYRLNRAAQSQATEAGDQRCTVPQQVCPRLRETEDASEICPVPQCTSIHSMSTLATYKSKPDNVYAYAYENRKLKTRKKKRPSRVDVDTSDKDATDGSKFPVVCLKRLKILVSQHPPQSHQSTDLTSETRRKPERTVLRVLEREATSQGTLSEESVQTGDSVPPTEQPSLEYLQSSGSPGALEVSQPTVQEVCNIHQESMILAISSDPDPLLQPGTEEIHSKHDCPSEPRSVPCSDLFTKAGLNVDVESYLNQLASDPSAESELQIESESDVASEQHLESVLLASEQEFESDPDSTAEVTLNLEPESVWEAKQLALPPDNSCETVSEPTSVHQPTEERPEIENEDFCAVCLIGGDLLCCDHCPKVFHLSCHVPPLHSFPTGDWICTLCRDVEQPEVEYDCENVQMSTGTVPYGLSACDQRKCDKLTLLILSNILSAPFHEPVSPLARHYYQIIKKPMDLSVIRNRLIRNSHRHYQSPHEFVADFLLMFKNCAKFNYSDSEVAQAGHSLQSFFTSKLREVFPDLSYPDREEEEEDSDSEDYEELERAVVTGFHWPERKEQSHRKRKRRHSLNWRRNHY
ncbi:tripartite motif-containing protein 66-like isoform X2 [Xyrauchen texanus]|uniref:tripartite motif-containing protein 66-like isoform X2 n=1 Tax=Xyrauchen texanus TaxID=154827 RepID=UPI002241F082|nr:tripartite motif-containing protein 66-like isoform X2 [Xyrauchen texanus]